MSIEVEQSIAFESTSNLNGYQYLIRLHHDRCRVYKDGYETLNLHVDAARELTDMMAQVLKAAAL